MNEEVGLMLGMILTLLFYALVIWISEVIKKRSSRRKERQKLIEKYKQGNYNISWKELQVDERVRQYH